MTRVSLDGAHSGAIASPAGSDGVGGPFLRCRGALDGDGNPLDCCGRCAQRHPKHGRWLHAPVLNERRQWECEGQVLHDGTVRPPIHGVIHKSAVGKSTA